MMPKLSVQQYANRTPTYISRSVALPSLCDVVFVASGYWTWSIIRRNPTSLPVHWSLVVSQSSYKTRGNFPSRCCRLSSWASHISKPFVTRVDTGSVTWICAKATIDLSYSISPARCKACSKLGPGTQWDIAAHVPTK